MNPVCGCQHVCKWRLLRWLIDEEINTVFVWLFMHFHTQVIAASEVLG